MKILTLSEADSNRFGLTIVRGQIQHEAQSEELLDGVHSLKPDIVIFRCPAGMIAPVHRLIQGKFSPFHADTLVYHERTLGASPTAPRGDQFSVTKAIKLDLAGIRAVASSAFSGYRSHYNANPLLDPKRIVDGYVEWALAYLAEEREGRVTWVIKQDHTVVGFATCTVDLAGSTVEIVLNAVHPKHESQGAYRCLLDSIIAHYHLEGLARIIISTQIWNYRVQRAWMRAGFVLTHAFDTYHINTMLRKEAPGIDS